MAIWSGMAPAASWRERMPCRSVAADGDARPARNVPPRWYRRTVSAMAVGSVTCVPTMSNCPTRSCWDSPLTVDATQASSRWAGSGLDGEGDDESEGAGCMEGDATEPEPGEPQVADPEPRCPGNTR